MITQLANNDPTNSNSYQATIRYETLDGLILSKDITGTSGNIDSAVYLNFYTDGELERIQSDSLLRVDFSYDGNFWEEYVVSASQTGLLLSLTPIEVNGQTKIREIKFTEMLSEIVEFAY